jgi:hypothetical protein
MPSTTIMARRECFDRVGLLDETLTYGDWEICIRLLSRYRAGFIDRPLAYYRIHTSNTSVGPGVSPERVRGDSIAVLHKVREMVDRLDGDRARLLRAIEASAANVDRRYARMLVDRFLHSGTGDIQPLKTAWKVSPRDVYRSRQTLAILRQMFGYVFYGIPFVGRVDRSSVEEAFPRRDDA